MTRPSSEVPRPSSEVSIPTAKGSRSRMSASTENSIAAGRPETPGVKQVEVLQVNNPENYEDETNQTGLSHYEMRIMDSFYSAPVRPRSKAYTEAQEADQSRRTDRVDRRAAKKERRASRSSKKKAPVEHEPNTVGWALDNTKKLGILNLSKMDLSEVPAEVFDSMPGTARIINISCNRLTTLDERLCDYVLVQRLIVSANLLTSIPITISRMTALKNLHLARNKLTDLPDAFSGMRFLEQVDLSENHLSSLPASLMTVNLKALNISKNNFSEAPVEISTMEWLMNLDMSHNLLKRVPAEYGALHQMIGLNLDNNDISDLPNEILETCTELVTLRLRANPITMSVLEEKQSYSQFNARRNMKFRRQLDSGTISEADLLPADG